MRCLCALEGRRWSEDDVATCAVCGEDAPMLVTGQSSVEVIATKISEVMSTRENEPWFGIYGNMDDGLRRNMYVLLAEYIRGTGVEDVSVACIVRVMLQLARTISLIGWSAPDLRAFREVWEQRVKTL